MGTTRGYIDDVRFVSNYSSGKLGTLIAEELYRHGVQTDVICGPCPYQPRSATHLTRTETNDEMEDAVRQAVKGGARAGVFAASVLDFVPEQAASGKLSSQEHTSLTVNLRRTSKIIAGVQIPIKVGFKLEVGLNAEMARKLAQTYINRYGLTMLVVNDLADVDEKRHRALVFEPELSLSGEKEVGRAVEVGSKRELAQIIAAHITQQLSRHELSTSNI
jgi:phosphopantothenoylcysteine synthetase/decarboxylase